MVTHTLGLFICTVHTLDNADVLDVQTDNIDGIGDTV